MKYFSLLAATLALASSALAAESTKTPEIQEQIGKTAYAVIINNEGKEIGHAHLTQGAEGVVIEIEAHDLEPGKHGVHFHEIGNCTDHEHFKKSGGHIMPSGKPHGFLHEEGPHEGNLPNLIVAENGTVHVEMYNNMVSLQGNNGKPALLGESGSALIIHTNVDDHLTQPIGGSGERIACGVIEKAGK